VSMTWFRSGSDPSKACSFADGATPGAPGVFGSRCP
jgi:hypothetical protein